LIELSQTLAVQETSQEFAQRLALPFSNYLLLSRALTHRSYLNENHDALEDNERLEFLGDAVLDYLVAYWLYNRYPEMQEGELTRLRSALVDTQQLAHFAREIGLGPLMRLGKGEEDGGGRDRDTLLCGTFEALVGALRLDVGLDAVRVFVEPMLADAAYKVIFEEHSKDPKSRLQEWSQAEGKGIPQYEIVRTSGPDHAKLFHTEVLIDGECMGRGEGPSKQKSSIEAASTALHRLEIE